MSAPVEPVSTRVTAWYADAQRDLPWRRPGVSPWAVLVSEVMLQQTPVTRVIPAYEAWLDRWPVPSALAAEPAGEAVRQWGRLGYPRRALALHRAATAITTDHQGEVPSDLDALLSLPGVGAYTARAVAAFAFGGRYPVVDTNVRRVLSRHRLGIGLPAGSSTTTSERDSVAELLPPEPAAAVRTSVALMELGALVCVARQPRCGACPVVDDCAWRRAGYPPSAPGRRQLYVGTDRQARGRLLALLRESAEPVAEAALSDAWPEAAQRSRALAGLLADGLVTARGDGRYALPA